MLVSAIKKKENFLQSQRKTNGKKHTQKKGGISRSQKNDAFFLSGVTLPDPVERKIKKETGLVSPFHAPKIQIIHYPSIHQLLHHPPPRPQPFSKKNPNKILKTIHPNLTILPARTKSPITQSNTSDRSRMARECLIACSGACIPYFDHTVFSPRHDPQ